MEIAYQACWTFGTIFGIIGGILASKHYETLGIWIVFSTTVLLSLGFHLFWQNKVWDKEVASVDTVQQPTNLSDADIQKIVDGVARKLSESNQAGDAVFGVLNKNIFPAKILKQGGLYIKWDTSRITEETKDNVTILFPEMIGNIGNIKNITFSGNTATLYKHVGDKHCPFEIGTMKICAEVVKVENGVTIIRVTIVKSNG